MSISDHQQQGIEQPHIGLLNAKLVLQCPLTEEKAWHWQVRPRVENQNLCLQNRLKQHRSFVKPVVFKQGIPKDACNLNI